MKINNIIHELKHLYYAVIFIHDVHVYFFLHAIQEVFLLTGFLVIFFQLEAKSSKYIHFPVLPIIGRGEVTIQISAYSSLRYERVQKTITLDVSGISDMI